MLLSDIDSWNVGALQSIAFELGDELATIEGVASDLELISRLPTSMTSRTMKPAARSTVQLISSALFNATGR